MPDILMMVGAPGSGKSTFSKNLIEQNPDFAYVSPDQIREELAKLQNKDKYEKTRENEQKVMDEAMYRVEKALSEGNTVVFDSTAAHPLRSKTIEHFRQLGAKNIIGIYFKLPLETLKKRNLQRKDSVPEDVLEKMYSWLIESPPENNNFNQLYIVNEHNELREHLPEQEHKSPPSEQQFIKSPPRL